MPAKQRGSASRHGRGWRGAFYDEGGKLRRKGGFETKSAALDWAEARAKEALAIRRGDPSILRRRDMPTFAELVDEFTEQHNCEANTMRTLKARLRYVTEGPALDGAGGWKDLRIDRLQVGEVGAWRKRLPARSAWHIHKALRQVLAYAVAAKLLDENVAKAVPNPEPKRREVLAFSSVAELEALAAELPAMFAPVPVFVGLTGLRCSEWLALERGDVDRAAGVVHVRRVYVDGTVKLYGKQAGSLRTIPLPARAALALEELPPRLDTRLLFAGERGGFLSLHNWRRDHWNIAVKAAGLMHRTPYSLRHSYAAFSIAAGIPLFELSRHMGTSVEQIGRTYGHLLPDSRERARQALDTFIAGATILREATE